MFEKGHQKLGGRKKGTKNKKTLISANELLLEQGINPLEKLIELAESDDSSVEQRIRCWQEIAKYTYPKLKTREPFIEENQQPDKITIQFVSPDGSLDELNSSFPEQDK